jgi:Ni2+-binding GTPase involved in maturation of urease and hydrogenase
MREAVEKKVLSENDRLAMALRQCYRDEGILCVNVTGGTRHLDARMVGRRIFHRSALMILTKTNLLPHVEFSAELALEDARKIALSARTGEGLDLWMAWLGAIQQKVQPQAAAAIA